MKKIIAGVLALAATTGFAFAELSFSNEIASDIVNVVHIKDAEKEDKVSFAGITEKMSAEYTSDKVDVFAEAEVGLGSLDDPFNGKKVDDDEGFGILYTDFDWFIHFRPFSVIELALHDGYSFDGSYFPVYDDNVPGAGLGSDGFTVVFSPIEHLSIGATVPFGFDHEGGFVESLFSGKRYVYDEDGKPVLDENGVPETYKKKFNFGVGVSFEVEDLFVVGANLRDVLDGDNYDEDGGRQFGAYISFLGLDKLVLNGGFTYTAADCGVELAPDYFGFGEVTAEKLINAALIYDAEPLSLSADAAYSLDDETGDYDLYVGAGLEYQLNDQFSVGVSGFVLNDFSDDGEDLLFGVNPSITYSVNEHHEFGAGAQIEFSGDNRAFNFPVYWKYSL